VLNAASLSLVIVARTTKIAIAMSFLQRHSRRREPRVQ
jgi:hypothetical protein